MPYIGYFQLINSVDKFILYDTVTYIKRGWINRNRLIINKEEHLFSVPLVKASQNKRINEINIQDTNKWSKQLLKTIEMNYKKAPQFDKVFPLLKSIFNNQEKNLSKFILHSLHLINQYLNITTEIVPSSNQYHIDQLKGQDKIIQICKEENAETYINPINGMKLYNKEDFSREGISLYFIKSKDIKYKQFNTKFIPNLSIIDVLMFNNKEQVKEFLTNYELV